MPPSPAPTRSKSTDRTVTAKNIVIATGSSVTPLPGVEIDQKVVVDSTGALELPKVPEHLVVIGGGVIGLELGSVWRRLGAKVTCVEFLDQILPGFDGDVRKEANKIMKKQGIEFRLGTKVTAAKVNGSKAVLTVEPAKGGAAETIEADCVLVSIGRRPNTEGLGLDKIGLHGNDTSELFFDEVKLPADRLLGAENAGFIMLMSQLPQERLSIAVQAQGSAQRAFDEAVKFTRDRKAFGRTVIEFQNTRFTLADMATQLQVGWAHLDWAIARHVAGKLTPAEASAAKLWHSEMQFALCDAALQLHGGAGYMNEYPIARLWRDARVTRIYGRDLRKS